MPKFLIDRTAGAHGEGAVQPTFLFAHGAGSTMDTDFMTLMATELGGAGIRVVRFEFDYMASRRSGGAKRPPPKIDLLQSEMQTVIAELACVGPLVIGGKSMGGRVASLIAAQVMPSSGVAGLLCLGYPFHPQGKPEKLRTAHLADLEVPTLICQGTRDPFGSYEDVQGYSFSASTAVHWVEDGDHDLKPRKRVTGRTHTDALKACAAHAANWMMDL